MDSIKNIIFDLGGVLLDIDFTKTMAALQKLGFENLTDLTTFNYDEKFSIHDFECGKITPEQFRKGLSANLKGDVSDQQIDDALNAVLLEIPVHRVELLNALKRRYRLFLFSNTNAINEKAFTQKAINQYGYNIFEKLFERAVMSHHIHMRKPDPNAFLYFIEKYDCTPSKTLFIDDIPQNIEAAKTVGMHAIWLQKGMDIKDLFDARLRPKKNLFHQC